MPARALPPSDAVAKGVPTPTAAHRLADRDMTCAAGFYPTGDGARAAVWQLHAELGLDLSRVTVVSPGALDWAAARWRTGRPGAGWGALVGGLAGVLPMLAWAAAPAPPGMALAQAAGVVLGAAVGALVGGLLAMLLGVRPAGRRFDDTVRRQLCRGHHAVVVHGVPSAQQAAVLALLRRTGLRWCAEAPRTPRRRLGATPGRPGAR